MAYNGRMVIIETSVFTRQITRLVNDDSYRALQQELARNPEAGDVIPHSSGLRKIRWPSSTRGKRGGIRVIYWRHAQDETIYMLLAYGKGEKDDLSAVELKTLRRLVLEELS